MKSYLLLDQRLSTSARLAFGAGSGFVLGAVLRIMGTFSSILPTPNLLRQQKCLQTLPSVPRRQHGLRCPEQRLPPEILLDVYRSPR